MRPRTTSDVGKPINASLLRSKDPTAPKPAWRPNSAVSKQAPVLYTGPVPQHVATISADATPLRRNSDGPPLARARGVTTTTRSGPSSQPRSDGTNRSAPEGSKAAIRMLTGAVTPRSGPSPRSTPEAPPSPPMRSGSPKGAVAPLPLSAKPYRREDSHMADGESSPVPVDARENAAFSRVGDFVALAEVKYRELRQHLQSEEWATRQTLTATEGMVWGSLVSIELSDRVSAADATERRIASMRSWTAAMKRRGVSASSPSSAVQTDNESLPRDRHRRTSVEARGSPLDDDEFADDPSFDSETPEHVRCRRAPNLIDPSVDEEERAREAAAEAELERREQERRKRKLALSASKTPPPTEGRNDDAAASSDAAASPSQPQTNPSDATPARNDEASNNAPNANQFETPQASANGQENAQLRERDRDSRRSSLQHPDSSDGGARSPRSSAVTSALSTHRAPTVGVVSSAASISPHHCDGGDEADSPPPRSTANTAKGYNHHRASTESLPSPSSAEAAAAAAAAEEARRLKAHAEQIMAEAARREAEAAKRLEEALAAVQAREEAAAKREQELVVATEAARLETERARAKSEEAQRQAEAIAASEVLLASAQGTAEAARSAAQQREAEAATARRAAEEAAAQISLREAEIARREAALAFQLATEGAAAGAAAQAHTSPSSPSQSRDRQQAPHNSQAPLSTSSAAVDPALIAAVVAEANARAEEAIKAAALRDAEIAALREEAQRTARLLAQREEEAKAQQRQVQANDKPKADGSSAAAIPAEASASTVAPIHTEVNSQAVHGSSRQDEHTIVGQQACDVHASHSGEAAPVAGVAVAVSDHASPSTAPSTTASSAPEADRHTASPPQPNGMSPEPSDAAAPSAASRNSSQPPLAAGAEVAEAAQGVLLGTVVPPQVRSASSPHTPGSSPAVPLTAEESSAPRVQQQEQQSSSATTGGAVVTPIGTTESYATASTPADQQERSRVVLPGARPADSSALAPINDRDASTSALPTHDDAAALPRAQAAPEGEAALPLSVATSPVKPEAQQDGSGGRSPQRQNKDGGEVLLPVASSGSVAPSAAAVTATSRSLPPSQGDYVYHADDAVASSHVAAAETSAKEQPPPTVAADSTSTLLQGQDKGSHHGGEYHEGRDGGASARGAAVPSGTSSKERGLLRGDEQPPGFATESSAAPSAALVVGGAQRGVPFDDDQHLANVGEPSHLLFSDESGLTPRRMSEAEGGQVVGPGGEFERPRGCCAGNMTQCIVM